MNIALSRFVVKQNNHAYKYIIITKGHIVNITEGYKINKANLINVTEDQLNTIYNMLLVNLHANVQINSHAPDTVIKGSPLYAYLEESNLLLNTSTEITGAL